ncbi:hypothetical protein [Pseudomonas phage PA7]|uniref:Uncharacterized protein n=1 Tax=Pseudomonas phage PA7 TaxID=347330 RepID=A0AAE7S682_9CAUD|nr:hypothetical protein [Pseudomonas phage PA7]
MDSRLSKVFQNVDHVFTQEQTNKLVYCRNEDMKLTVKVDAMLALINNDPVKYKDLEKIIIEDTLAFIKAERSSIIGIALFNKMVYVDQGPDAVGFLEYTKVAEYASIHVDEYCAWVNMYRDKMKSFVMPILTQFLGNALVRSELKTLQAQRYDIAKQNFRDMGKPAPEGTVKELAAKYGKSISEIRRMKAEGRLGELTQE